MRHSHPFFESAGLSVEKYTIAECSTVSVNPFTAPFEILDAGCDNFEIVLK